MRFFFIGGSTKAIGGGLGTGTLNRLNPDISLPNLFRT